jgi:Arc/MetJ-type ribon-helix-helix transcriptional regulator
LTPVLFANAPLEIPFVDLTTHLTLDPVGTTGPMTFLPSTFGTVAEYDLFIPESEQGYMVTAVRKTISLPPELARQVEEMAKAEGKSVSAVVQDALRLARRQYFEQELRGIQSYWSRKAREKGILTEKDLRRYLGN